MGAVTARNDKGTIAERPSDSPPYRRLRMLTQQPAFRLINSKVEPLTKEFAEYFRDLEPSPTERELNPSRLAHLRAKADAGQLSDQVQN